MDFLISIAHRAARTFASANGQKHKTGLRFSVRPMVLDKTKVSCLARIIWPFFCSNKKPVETKCLLKAAQISILSLRIRDSEVTFLGRETAEFFCFRELTVFQNFSS